ncbi:MAG TPA: hypothetical protein VFI68_08595, partial [Anaerolineales bacterium]|nr:hypothetical protein [Anaerolineales bacterium]
GNLTEARRIFVETTRAFQKDGSAIGVVVTVQYMAGLFVAADKAEGAARLIGWADTMRAVINDKRPLLEQADVDRDVAASIARIGRTAFDEAYNNGRSLSLDGAVGYALEET